MVEKLSGGVECMRCFLLFLNILFLIIGIALLGIGIYIKLDTEFASTLSDLADKTGDVSTQAIGFLGYMMIAAGVITILIALFGCVGTLWHNRCLLWTYAIILLTLMITEVVAFGMAVAYKKDLRGVYEKALRSIFDDGFDGPKLDIIKGFKSLEDTVKCCGVHNITDYDNKTKPENFEFSKSCKTNNNTGCADAIVELLDKNLPIVSGTLGGILLLELITLLGAVALAVALKHAGSENYSKNPREVLGYGMPIRRRDYR